MTPHHLDALAAAHSLAAALDGLDKAAAELDADRAAAADDVRDGLRSPLWGGTGRPGGHGDPTGTAALYGAHSPSTGNRYADRAQRARNTIAWLINRPDLTDPIPTLLDLLPTLAPDRAAIASLYLVDEDARCRAVLDLPPARLPLPGVACPGCGQRRLEVCQDGPPREQAVVCANPDCRCTGAGCGCGMPGAVEGAPHIWPRAAVIGAVGGAR